MFFEIRQYRVRPGMMADWAKFMDETLIPFQISKGMVVVGSFTGLDEEDLYVWIRRFDNEAEREKLYAACYQSDTWLNEIKPIVDTMLLREKIVVTRVVPTSRSVIR